MGSTGGRSAFSARVLPLALALTGGLLCLGGLQLRRRERPEGGKEGGDAGSLRRLLLQLQPVPATQLDFTAAAPPVTSGTTPPALDERHSGGYHGNGTACTPRSVETFPRDLFTLEQKRQGAILIHALACLWLFTALAIVCDDYFVASLEVVCEALRLKPDVAGATFMAAGNSSTQLVAAIIGVFIAESDVGVSTIVGSAVFNNLMIVSLCGLAGARMVRLTFWPLVRDCGFYALSVAALVAVIHDGRVHWYESVILIALLASYVTVMVFNSRLESGVHRCLPRLANLGRPKAPGDVEAKRIPGGLPQQMEIWSVEMGALSLTGDGGIEDSASVEVSLKTAYPSSQSSLFTPPTKGVLRRAHWLVTLPWALAFRATIPDCRRPGVWRRLFVLTFLASVVWIWGLVYLLVWMVCSVGDVMGIPDTVMGLTLLAVGTCIPDALAGVFVARTGLGDMAVANALASNVFDITACLGIPWFIRTAVLTPGASVVINSAGLTYTSITLLTTVLFLLGAVSLNRMQVDRKLGAIFLAVYAGVVTMACLYETNSLGPLNPPPCPRMRT